jgi:hypothetical protein
MLRRISMMVFAKSTQNQNSLSLTLPLLELRLQGYLLLSSRELLRFYDFSSVASAAATRSPVPSATPVANSSPLKASPPSPRAGVPAATPVANPSLLKASPPSPRAGVPAATPVSTFVLLQPTPALSQTAAVAAVASSVTAQPKRDNSFDEFDEFSDVPGHIPGPVASSTQSKAAATPIKVLGKTTAHLSPKSGVVIYLLILPHLLFLLLLYVKFYLFIYLLFIFNFF